MKKTFLNVRNYGAFVAVALTVVLLWSATVFPFDAVPSFPEFDPPQVPANPKLLQLSEDWKPPTVYQVSDNIYVAIGYARANPVLIEGTDGLIVIDPAESINAAEIVKKAFNDDPRLNNVFSRKPVKAIIYTHYHDCPFTAPASLRR